MLNIGSKISLLRKEKGWAQGDLAEQIGVSRVIIVRYERNEAAPSIDVAKPMADALEVSLDYLTGSTNFVIQDKKMLYRLELLQKIAQPERDRILLLMDSLLRDAQINLTQQKLA